MYKKHRKQQKKIIRYSPSIDDFVVTELAATRCDWVAPFCFKCICFGLNQAKMPCGISSDTKSMIIALRPEDYSIPKIVEKLKQLGKSVSLMTVRRVLQRQQLEQQG